MREKAGPITMGRQCERRDATRASHGGSPSARQRHDISVGAVVKAGVLILVACVTAGLWSAVDADATGVRGTHIPPSRPLMPSSATYLSTSAGGIAGNPFVISSVETLDTGQAASDAVRAYHDSPAAVLAREESQTRFAGMGAHEAAVLASEVFPGALATPAAPPELPEGVRITGYPTDHAAQIETPEGQRALLESTTPLAVETSPRERKAIDLHLAESAGAFTPIRTPAPVRIASKLSDGTTLADSGVSLTPTGPRGQGLQASSGKIDGSAVFYGASGSDMDTAVKPTAAGFEVDALLRSARSPRRLYFRVGLPEGATLSQSRDEAGAIELKDDGELLATILPPHATDASGWPVPVSMRLSGHDLIALTLEGRPREYRYPLDVDPVVTGEDSHLTEPKSTSRGNWEFHSEHESSFGHSITNEGLRIFKAGEYQSGEGWQGYWGYETKGDSSIYELSGEDEAANEGARVESEVALFYYNGSERKIESNEILSAEAPKQPNFGKRAIEPPLCAQGGCTGGHGQADNVAAFEVAAARPSSPGTTFSDELYNAIVHLWEPEGTHATTSYNSENVNVTVEGKEAPRANVLGPDGGWLSHYRGAFETIAKDPGIGVEKTRLEYLNGKTWEPVGEHGYGPGPGEEGLCQGVQCKPLQAEKWTLPSRLPNGEDRIRYRAEEAMAGTESLPSEGEATIKVDTEKPHNLELSGLPYGNELSERKYTLQAAATDGVGSDVPASGVEAIALYANENLIGEKTKEKGGEGWCTQLKGECTADATFELNGAELGAGQDKIVVVAKDYAGNEARQPYTISVRHSTPVALGPGSVDLQSGDFALGATDVSMGQGLTVSRVYSSRGLTLGQDGPLGPQWLISIGTDESLSELVDGAVMLTAANGGQTLFAPIAETFGCPATYERKFESPPGDANIDLTLKESCEEKEGKKVYRKLSYSLQDPADHTKVQFTEPTGAPEKLWLPTVQEGTIERTDTVTFLYRTSEVEAGGGEKKKVIEPLEALAPKPVGAVCPEGGEFKFASKEAEEKARGCRGLTFNYAESTTATGESQSQWGDYKGDLTRVYFNAWNPAEGKMAPPIEVAHYLYDSRGRLRAEWDPRYEKEKGACTAEPGAGKCLKTLYGYDEEGHLTALSPPGQEPYYFTYGTAKGDSNPGRLVKYYRPPASTPLSALPPGNEALPTLSGSPIVGVRMGASNGSWKNESWWATPAIYAYQWEDCNASGEACTAIAGADNANYTPMMSDVGHSLRAKVTATNAGGSAAVSTSPSPVVAGAPTPSPSAYLYSDGSGAWLGREIGGIARTPYGDLWVADWWRGKVIKLDKEGHEIASTTFPEEDQAGGLGGPSGVALDPAGDVWVADPIHNDIREFSPSGVYMKTFGADVGGSGVDVCTTTCHEATRGSGDGEFAEPAGVAVDPYGNVWVADTGNHRVQELGAEGEFIRQVAVHAYGIAIAPSGEVWAAGGTTVVALDQQGDIVHQFGSRGTGPGELEGAYDVAVGPHDRVWVTDYANKRVEELNEAGEYLTQFTLNNEENELERKYTRPLGVAVSVDGNHAWVVSWGEKALNLQLHEWSVPQSIEAQELPPQPGSSIEYGVPISSAVKTAAQVEATLNPGLLATSDVAPASGGDVWAVGLGAGEGPGLVLELGPAGERLRRIDTGFCLPTSATTDENGDLWVTELICAKVQEYSPEGKLMRQFWSFGEASGEMSAPMGIAVDSGRGHVWVADMSRDTISELTDTGTYLAHFGSKGSGAGQLSYPRQVAVDRNGDVWVADQGNNRIDELSASGSFIRAIGFGVADGQARPESCTSACRAGIPGTGEGQLNEPTGIAMGSQGDVLVADRDNARVEVFSGDTGDPIGQWGAKGKGFGELSAPSALAAAGSDEVWVSDESTGSLTDYVLDREGESAPYEMSPTSVAAWGQEDDPYEATAITPPDQPQGWPATDYRRGTVYYLDKAGRLVNTANPSHSPYGAIATTEYNDLNEAVRTLSVDNRVKALEVGSHSAEESKLLDTRYVYNGERGEPELDSPAGTELVEEKGPEHMVKAPEKEGKEVLGRALTEYAYDTEYVYNEAEDKEHQVKPPEGEAYDLQTESQSFVKLAGTNETIEARTTKTSYAGQNDLGWRLRAPTSVTTDPKLVNEAGGANLTDTTIYYTKAEEPDAPACGKHPELEGLVCETRGPTPKAKAGDSAHDARTIYYSAGDEAGTPACENRPEWAELVCRTIPVAQPANDPESTHAPKLPVSTMASYNIYDQPEVITEEYGPVTRTKTDEYDSAGRLLVSNMSSSDPAKEKPLPEVTYGYSETTGQQVSESAEGVTVEGTFNALGELTEYKDGRGSVACYAYEEPGGLVKEIRDSSEGGKDCAEYKAYQRYSYDETTKALTALEDSAFPGHPFTAAYDPEGKMTSETYPNAMCANYAYNAVGDATHLEYVKSADCSDTGAKVWYAEAITPSIHGETLSDQSTLATANYAYDHAGRLTGVQETPKEKGCTVRSYVYTTEGDRKSLTTREPKANGECATKAGEAAEEAQEHEYDEAGRLIDSGVEYDELGNTTHLPAPDAGGQELKTSYYASNQVDTQTQAGKAIEYRYDPEGRQRASISAGREAIPHYDDSGEAIGWEEEREGANVLNVTRNIPGIDGSLAAIEENNAEPEILMHDLKGDVVGKCAANPGAENPSSMYDSTEFGVPTTKEPPKYSWLGASGVASERPSGVIVEGGTSYVPQTGMTLQPEAVEPPGLPGGSGGGGVFVSPEEPWVMQAAGELAAAAPGRESEREIEVAIAACHANPEACDPEGVMDGEETHHFGMYWYEQAQHIKDIGATECLASIKAVIYPLCMGAYEAKHHEEIYEDEQLSHKLEWCYGEIQHPHTERRRDRQGRLETYTVTGMCYFEYGGWVAGGIRAVENPSVSICWDEPWNSNNPDEEWWCPNGVGGGRRWWKWKERGIHGELHGGHT